MPATPMNVEDEINKARQLSEIIMTVLDGQNIITTLGALGMACSSALRQTDEDTMLSWCQQIQVAYKRGRDTMARRES